MWQKTAAKQHGKYQVFEDHSLIKAIQDDDMRELKDVEDDLKTVDQPKLTRAEQTAIQAIEQEATNGE